MSEELSRYVCSTINRWCNLLGIFLWSGGRFHCFLITQKLMEEKALGDIAHVREGKVFFEGPNLFVEDIHLMNLGMEKVRKDYLERALGVVIEPYNDDGRATLANNGQLQLPTMPLFNGNLQRCRYPGIHPYCAQGFGYRKAGADYRSVRKRHQVSVRSGKKVPS